MDGQELIKLLAEKFDTAEFAHNDWDTPKGFAESDDLQKARKIYGELNNKKDKDSKEKKILTQLYTEIGKKRQEEILSFMGVPYFYEVDQKGGEGEGDEWYSVKYFPDLDIYLRIDGFYQSYDGTSFDALEKCTKVVRPQKKTITVYI